MANEANKNRKEFLIKEVQTLAGIFYYPVRREIIVKDKGILWWKKQEVQEHFGFFYNGYNKENIFIGMDYDKKEIEDNRANILAFKSKEEAVNCINKYIAQRDNWCKEWIEKTEKILGISSDSKELIKYHSFDGK